MRRIVTHREQWEMTWPWRVAVYDPEAPLTDTDMPIERNDQGHIRVHRGLVLPPGTDVGEVANKKGLGPHWSTNRQIAEALGDPAEYGKSDNDIGVIYSGWHDPAHGRNLNSDDITGGEGHHNEQELTMNPGTPIHVDQVHFSNGRGWHPLKNWKPRTVWT